MDDLPSEGRPRFPIHPRWLVAAILAPVIASSGCSQVQSASQEIGARLKAQADYTWKFGISSTDHDFGYSDIVVSNGSPPPSPGDSGSNDIASRSLRCCNAS